MPAYASSGQNNRGTANRSRCTTNSPAQANSATVRRICAAAIENCSAATKPMSASRPISSRRVRGGSSGAMARLGMNWAR